MINIVRAQENQNPKNMAMTKVEKSLVKNKKKPYDLGLILTIFMLLALGLIIVLSASAPSALSSYGDSYHFFKNQLVSAALGLVAMFVVSLIDYRKYKGKLANLGIIGSIVLLIMVLIPRSRYNDKRCYKMDKLRISIPAIRNNENSTNNIFSR